MENPHFRENVLITYSTELSENWRECQTFTHLQATITYIHVWIYTYTYIYIYIYSYNHIRTYLHSIKANKKGKQHTETKGDQSITKSSTRRLIEKERAKEYDREIKPLMAE